MAIAPQFTPRPNGPVLVTRFGALGDLVQFSATVAAIADHHDQPVDVLTGGGSSAEVLTGMPEIARRFSLSHRRRPLWLAPDKLRLIRELVARRYAHVYALDRVGGLEEELARQGAVIHDGGLLTSHAHALDADRERLDGFGIEVPSELAPCVTVSAAERAAARRLLAQRGLGGRPVVVFQPGSSRTMHPLHRLRPARNLKAWPVDQWSALADAIAQRHPTAALVFAGAPSESVINRGILATLHPAIRARSADLADALPVRTLAGLLAEAGGCISVDTGPAHLAAAFGCPLVVLFGPADAEQMAPRGPAPVEVVRSGVACSPCHGTPRRGACRENVCMRRIEVPAVLDAWERLGLDAELARRALASPRCA